MSIGVRLTELVTQEIKLAGGVPPAHLQRTTILAATGLDSLGFATLVVAMKNGRHHLSGDLW
jgi:hypothetical protein